jgi:hypothetical protein
VGQVALLQEDGFKAAHRQVTHDAGAGGSTPDD